MQERKTENRKRERERDEERHCWGISMAKDTSFQNSKLRQLCNCFTFFDLFSHLVFWFRCRFSGLLSVFFLFSLSLITGISVSRVFWIFFSFGFGIWRETLNLLLQALHVSLSVYSIVLYMSYAET